MEVIIRIAAAALIGCAAALVMKRGGAALSLPLAAIVCAFAGFTAALTALKPLRALLDRARELSGLGGAYFLPVAKCVAIGVITKAAADLCRDGGQTAMAGAVEFGGVAAALFVSLPLLETLLGLLEKLL